MKTYLARLLVFNVERLFNPKVLFQIQKLALKSAIKYHISKKNLYQGEVFVLTSH
jgi:hypothetical protein